MCGDQKKETAEGFTEKPMVYCPSMRKYVSVGFCFNGGPMRSEGKCDYFISMKSDKNQAAVVVHAIPTEQRIEHTIVEE